MIPSVSACATVIFVSCFVSTTSRTFGSISCRPMAESSRNVSPVLRSVTQPPVSTRPCANASARHSVCGAILIVSLRDTTTCSPPPRMVAASPILFASIATPPRATSS
uniref:Putative secreted protein n=1 Tax=Anopheles triannulatus TaxID=58253 RepID=A0A2M4B1V4_9DIPT